MLNKLDVERRDGRSYGTGSEIKTILSYTTDELPYEIFIKGIGWCDKNHFQKIPKKAFYILSKWKNKGEKTAKWHIIDFLT